MDKIFGFLFGRQPNKNEKEQKRHELEQKAIDGAKKALSEYKRVFDSLAEYDRTKS